MKNDSPFPPNGYLRVPEDVRTSIPITNRPPIVDCVLQAEEEVSTMLRSMVVDDQSIRVVS